MCHRAKGVELLSLLVLLTLIMKLLCKGRVMQPFLICPLCWQLWPGIDSGVLCP